MKLHHHKLVHSYYFVTCYLQQVQIIYFPQQVSMLQLHTLYLNNLQKNLQSIWSKCMQYLLHCTTVEKTLHISWSSKTHIWCYYVNIAVKIIQEN